MFWGFQLLQYLYVMDWALHYIFMYILMNYLRKSKEFIIIPIIAKNTQLYSG